MKRLLPSILTAALGMILVTVGLCQGQNAQVLAKAARICMECVGIG